MAKSFVISKEDQHLNIASLYLQRELAPAELQGCRKDDEEMSPHPIRHRKEGKVREDNPYTVAYVKQTHRSLGHLCSLSIQLSFLLLSKPLGSAFSLFL